MEIDLGIGSWINNVRTRAKGGDPSKGDMVISTANLITIMENIKDNQRSGIFIQTTLRNIADNFPNNQIKKLFNLLHLGMINNGEPLSQLMSKYKVAFPEYVVQIIAAAEESGRWTNSKNSSGRVEPGLVDLLINLLKRSNKAKRKLLAGMLYPAVILFATTVAMGIFSFTILPTLKEVFVALRVFDSMNFLSKGLFSFGEYFQQNYYLFPLFVIAVLGLSKLLWDFQGKKLWDHYKIRLRGIKNIFINMFIAESFMIFGVLCSAGLPVADGLIITAKACGSKDIAGGFTKSSNLIRSNGLQLHDALEQSHFSFKGEPIYRLRMAYQSGTIDEALMDYSEQLFEKLDEQIEGFIKLIEPAMLLIGGIVVGLLLVSFYGSISSAIAGIH